MNDLVLYAATRAEIERRDISRFLVEFQLSKNHRRRPRWRMGSVMFTVDGYNGDPNELYAIPEVRAYYQKAHNACPCWIYYSELTTESLKIIALCTIDNICAKKLAGTPSTLVSFSGFDLHRWIEDGLQTCALLGHRARLDEEFLSLRIESVMTYFGFSRTS